MANGSTTNLALIKPEVGADSDSWGGHINTDLDVLDALLATVITGLTLSAAGSTATFGIAAGAASGMTLSSAYTKTTSSWSVGSGNGALDTGTIANNTWYHVWLIQRSDTGVVDVLVSTSATSPTMPSNYDRKRRIGSVFLDGSGNWRKFSQYGDEFLFDVGVNVANTTVGTTASLIASQTPTGVKTIALLSGIVANAANTSLLFTSPDQSDVVPGNVTGNYNAYAAAGVNSEFNVRVRTSTTPQFRVRADTASTALICAVQGYVDPRGQY